MRAAEGGIGGGGGRVEGRLNLLNKAGEMAHFYRVGGTFYRTAGGVPHNKDESGTGAAAGEFQAAQNVAADNVAGDAHAEYVADALIEDEFGGDSGINTAENNGEGELAAFGVLYLGEQAAWQRVLGQEAPVSLFEHVKCGLGGDFCLGLAGLGFHGVLTLLTPLIPRYRSDIYTSDAGRGARRSAGLLGRRRSEAAGF